MVDAPVPTLEREATLQRLSVAGSGLGLDPDPKHRVRGRNLADDHRIPGALAARVGQRHFRPPTERRRDGHSQSLQQRSMSGVSQDRAARVCADAEVESNDASDANQMNEGDAVGFRMLDQGDGRARESACMADLSLGQTSAEPGEAELAPDIGQDGSRPLGSPVDLTLTRRH